MSSCSDVGDEVMGTGTISLSGGTDLTGVWSTISAEAVNALGGEQEMATASVVVDSAAGIDVDLIGETGTYEGTKLRVAQVETGDVFTTVFFTHDTEDLM